MAAAAGRRNTSSAIHFVLTHKKWYWHENLSDPVHIWNGGGSVKFHLLHPDGRYETVVCGSDVAKGERPHIIVPGGCWKAGELTTGAYFFSTEAVTPGWDYRDFRFLDADDLAQRAPADKLDAMCRLLHHPERPHCSLPTGYPEHTLKGVGLAVRLALKLAHPEPLHTTAA